MTKKTAAQLDHEIAEALGADKQPLHGHTSEATAYLVADYPYGYTLRAAAYVRGGRREDAR